MADDTTPPDSDSVAADDGAGPLPDALATTLAATPREQLSTANAALLEKLLAGEQRALARVLTKIEDRTAGARDLLAALYGHAGTTPVVGVTGSPGAGKSTLVDKLTGYYRERDETVGVLAVDPASPYTGGSVLGDRIRMGSTAGDEGVFIRSMSARGRLGGLSMATTDAVTAFEAFGMDRIIIETVGAGQNEVDIVETADTVAVVVQPGSGDDIQLLKAGILEIGDLFVVNKADMDEAAQTVADLEAMVHGAKPTGGVAGHHSVDIGPGSHDSADSPDSGSQSDATGNDVTADSDSSGPADAWTPPVIETIATGGEGISDFADAIAAHTTHLDESPAATGRRHQRAAATLQRLLRSDLNAISERLLAAHGGIDSLATAVAERAVDPYTLVDNLVEPVEAAAAGVTTDDSADAADEDDSMS